MTPLFSTSVSLNSPLDPSRWAHWLADYLGETAITLRAATAAAAAASLTSPGELS
jgi:hypothetical protein